MNEVPGVVLTITIRLYWVGVCLMAAWIRWRGGGTAGLVPHLRIEQAMWAIWAPIIIAWILLPGLATPVWIALPGLGGVRSHFLIAVPRVAFESPVFSSLRWAAAVLSVLSAVLIFESMVRMGKSWRIGVVPPRPTDLVTGGLYARIRHPIYALNILLMGCSVVIVPTIPMVAVGVLHTGLILLKARTEERFLLETHGEKYVEYSRRTGRFFPRLAFRKPDLHRRRPAGSS